MKALKIIVNLLLINSVFLFTAGCKRYKRTIIDGKLVNIPTGQGIANEAVTLIAHEEGGNGAEVPLEQTITDSQGNFHFDFEAWIPVNDRKRRTHSVKWLNLDNKSMMFTFSGRGNSNPSVDLTKYYNNNLLPWHTFGINDLKKNNSAAINVALGAFVTIVLSNSVSPFSPNDSVRVQFINQFGTFKFGGYNGEGSRVLNPKDLSDGYYPLWVCGETTLRVNIYKNGNVQVRDTTFFVESKDYYFEYYY